MSQLKISTAVYFIYEIFTPSFTYTSFFLRQLHFAMWHPHDKLSSKSSILDLPQLCFDFSYSCKMAQGKSREISLLSTLWGKLKKAC